MCGRFTLDATAAALAQYFRSAEAQAFPPRYNIAPSQPILVVRKGQQQRETVLVRWGLVPGWVKDIGAFSLLFNARSETILEKPAFRNAMRHRRCIIPASAFYEWSQAARGRKIPYVIRPADGRIMAFAGLWEYWADANGNELESAAIITVPANGPLSTIHGRMPALLEPDQFDDWLDTAGVSDKKAAEMLKTAPDRGLEMFAVSDRVNSAVLDDAALLEPAAPANDKAQPRTALQTRQMRLF